MPGPLTFANSFTSWTLDWPTALLAAVLLGWYLTAARGRQWPVQRTVSFVAGVAVLLYATCSFLGVYDQVLFWTRAVQNIVLLMGAPLLLAMGAPLTLLLASAPTRLADALRRAGRSRAGHLLAYPITVTVVLLSPMPVLYLTGLYPLTLRSAMVDAVVRAGIVAAGFLYYWTRLRVDPVPGGAQHLTSFAISFAEALADGILGVIVWLGPLVAEAHYRSVGRDWGPSLHRDQTMGAIALWFGGDLISLVYLGALFVQWFRDDSRTARTIDADLDRQAAERPAQTESTMQDGLWWQSDPRFANRRDLRDD